MPTIPAFSNADSHGQYPGSASAAYPSLPAPSPVVGRLEGYPASSESVSWMIPNKNPREEAVDIDARSIMRTPSPTPSEVKLLNTDIWGNDKTKKKRSCRDSGRESWNKESLISITVLAVIIAVVVVFLVYQNDILDAMKPFGDWLHRTPGAWLIPIAILFVLSFPPLFGSGIIIILCGTVWGVWIGFGIVAAGTILGELGNLFVFRWCCASYGRKWEDKYVNYAVLAQVVREGGFLVPTVMRYTSYPGHLLTAIFATCGMTVWEFLISAVLSLPKQLAAVYLGVAQSGSHLSSKGLAGLKAGIIVGITLLTYAALWYVGTKIERVKVKVVYARRKAR
ncbi:hypothetical protein C8Q77DRAFT_1156028 [Trametes polyzona]|nr:hypothetical protein C8Q77DRAFT_1156028 [Trametes polyzona]